MESIIARFTSEITSVAAEIGAFAESGGDLDTPAAVCATLLVLDAAGALCRARRMLRDAAKAAQRGERPGPA